MSFTFDADVNDVDAEETDIFDEEQELSFFDEEEFLAMGIDPSMPTDSKPGSESKVMMLAARYSAGLPLWHDMDRYDHGPAGFDLAAFGVQESASDQDLED
ncbi:hypothetical protein [Calycomorphotria hydatis]|uniref:Uncharacterized protein n=1 Tax=Calycomorphotria hydatis TaxID=2528027 RepID=A0A517TD00_9PLAN|nr:hypothetical protein [Calycomorphotria hydatis]QDT66251.1 hypothetical protein V22_35160 [Calycomorphotria hydatis]